MSTSNAQCVYLTKSTLSETTLRGVLKCFLTFVMSEALHNVMQHVQKWELLKMVITSIPHNCGLWCVAGELWSTGRCDVIMYSEVNWMVSTITDCRCAF